jgi:hypothetical protein
LIQIFRIPVSKERLHALSKNERVLFLLLGYVANQMMMMQKLLIFSTNDEPTELVQQQSTGVQTQMLLRLMIGLLFEARDVIVTRFNENALNVEYRRLLDENGQKALADLNQQFGKSNLLSTIRNAYAFHHPSSDEVEGAFAAALANSDLDEGDWSFYFAQTGFNSLFFISDFVIMHGIYKKIGESDWDAGQERIMSEVTRATNNIVEFAKAFTVAVWRKHFGEEMRHDKVIEVQDAPSIEGTVLPFFVEMPGEIPIRHDAIFGVPRSMKKP